MIDLLIIKASEVIRTIRISHTLAHDTGMSLQLEAECDTFIIEG